MKNLVVRAGKYFSVGILLISCLPILLPLLLFLSIFGFTFLLPAGCALAGFFFIRKYVGMLYRKLPTLTGGSRGRPLSGHPVRSADLRFTDYSLKDLVPIETSETVDPEFDAVVVSTGEEQGQSIEWNNDDGNRAELGATFVAEKSAAGGTEAEGIIAGIPVEDESRREQIDDDKFAEEGIRGDETEDNTLGEDSTWRERKEDDTTLEAGDRFEGKEDYRFVEDLPNGEGKEGIISVEDWPRGEGEEESTSSKDLPSNEEDTFAGEGPTGKGTDETTFAEDGSREGEDENGLEGETGETLVVEEPELQDLGRSTGLSDEQAGIRSEGGDYDGQGGEDEFEAAGFEDAEDRQDFGQPRDERYPEEGSQSADDQDTSKNSVTTVALQGLRQTDGEGDEVEIPNEEVKNSATTVALQGLPQTDGEGDEVEIPNEKVNEKNELALQGLPQTDGEGDEVEIPNEEVNEKNELVDTVLDDGFHTVPTVVDDERRRETVEDIEKTSGSNQTEGKKEDNKFEDKFVEERDGKTWPIAEADKPSEETQELMPEAIPPEIESHQESRSLIPTAISLGSSHYTSEEESPTKSNGSTGHLLRHQANEDDIWICKECGWRYPNAKPSAKIRRNHKKHCKGHPSPSSAGKEVQVGETGIGRFWSVDSDFDAGQFVAGGEANERSTEQSIKGGHLGSLTRRPSSLKGEKLSSLSAPQDDANLPDHEDQVKRVAFDDGAAVSSAEPNYDQESGVRSEAFRFVANEYPSHISESFHSAPDEFPDDSGRWTAYSVEGDFDDEQHQLDKVQQERQLRDDLNAVKGIVGDKHVSTGPLLQDIEELSELLGIDLPDRTPELPGIEWAKVAVEVLKIVVGID